MYNNKFLATKTYCTVMCAVTLLFIVDKCTYICQAQCELYNELFVTNCALYLFTMNTKYLPIPSHF